MHWWDSAFILSVCRYRTKLEGRTNNDPYDTCIELPIQFELSLMELGTTTYFSNVFHLLFERRTLLKQNHEIFFQKPNRNAALDGNADK